MSRAAQYADGSMCALTSRCKTASSIVDSEVVRLLTGEVTMNSPFFDSDKCSRGWSSEFHYVRNKRETMFVLGLVSFRRCEYLNTVFILYSIVSVGAREYLCYS